MVRQKQISEATTVLKLKDLGFQVIWGLAYQVLGMGPAFWLAWVRDLAAGCLAMGTLSLWQVSWTLRKQKAHQLASLLGVPSNCSIKQQPPGTMLWLWQGASSSLSLLKGPRPHICGGRLSMSTKEEQLPPEEAEEQVAGVWEPQLPHPHSEGE